MKPRVLHINTESEWRGGERQVLMQMVNTRTDVDNYLISKSKSPLSVKAKEEGFNVWEQAFRGLDLATARLVVRKVRSDQIDIVHCHTSRAHSIAAISKLIGMKAKLVVTKRTIFPIGKNFFSRLKYQKSDLVICISGAVEKCVLEALPNASTMVIPSGIEISSPVERVHASAQIPSLKNKSTVGYVAAYEYEKDPETFLKTAKIVTNKRPDTTFVWFGKGNREASIRSGIKAMGLQNSVFLLGFKKDIISWINGLDILFFPSKSEGFGSSILDAFLCKIPVITTNAGGLNELVQDGVNGFKCEIADAENMAQRIISLLDDPNLKKSFTENASKTLQNYDIKVISKKLLIAYKDVLNDS